MYQHNSTLKARQKPMPGPKKPMERTGKLAPQSAKMKATMAVQRATYAGMAKQAEARCCLACETTYDLQHSHVLPQGNNKLHRANPLNIVYLCSELSNGCHALYEHHKAEFALRYPEAYAEKVRRMWLIDPARTRFFLSKNPAPTP